MRRHETREDAILAWHFVRDDRSLGYDAKGLLVEPGYIYYTDGPVELCQSGLHASVDPFGALLGYAKGSYLCRVAVWGDVKVGFHQIVGRNREVLAAQDISRDLRLFACWCARQVWDRITDERFTNTVEVAERFANGEASEEELAKSRLPTEVALEAIGVSAAKAAAWNTAAVGAWLAARSAANNAAWEVGMGLLRAEFNRIIADRFGAL